MNFYFLLAQKIFNIDEIFYPENSLSLFMNIENDNQSNKLYNIIYDINNLKMVENSLMKAKYNWLKSILNNIFVSDSIKEDYLNIFNKIQKNYLSLNKFINLCKFKHKKIQVFTDLNMNLIDKINDKFTIIILQNNARYYFLLSDLNNIIESALSNSPDFYLDILKPKNPYTNLPFNKTILYNIYFKMKQNFSIISSLFHRFFLCNFDNELFLLENESFIRDFAIKKYVFNNPDIILFPFVMDLIKQNKYTKKLKIHEDFPKSILIKIMKPFLYHCYIYKYGVYNREKTFLYKKMLDYKLYKFYKYNKNFGRIKYNINQKKKKYYIFETKFNSDHLTFNQIIFSNSNIVYDKDSDSDSDLDLEEEEEEAESCDDYDLVELERSL